jgi:hypothetical protein
MGGRYFFHMILSKKNSGKKILDFFKQYIGWHKHFYSYWYLLEKYVL